MSIIKHVTLQKIVAHDFRYDPRIKVINICTGFMCCDVWTVLLVMVEGDTAQTYSITCFPLAINFRSMISRRQILLI